MIKFDPNKEKNINFTIDVQGIDPSLLEYNIRLSTGKIDYGFKGTNENGRLVFKIPALNEVVNKEVINDLSTIRIEVHDRNNKYYLKPFEDAVKIQQVLKVEAQLSEEQDLEDDKLPLIETELKSDDDTVEDGKDDDTIIDKKDDINEEDKTVQKKKTKFGDFLKD